MFNRKVLVAFASAVLLIPAIGAGQSSRAQSGPAETKVDVTIALVVAGQPFNFGGKALGTFAPVASIYEVNAQQWRVEHHDGPRSLSLTFWRPTSGSGDMFNLSCSINGKSYHVSTVKTNGGGTPEGSGKVTFTPAKPGGTFTIDAKTADGVAIKGTIKCSDFKAPVEEGG